MLVLFLGRPHQHACFLPIPFRVRFETEITICDSSVIHPLPIAFTYTAPFIVSDNYFPLDVTIIQIINQTFLFFFFMPVLNDAMFDECY